MCDSILNILTSVLLYIGNIDSVGTIVRPISNSLIYRLNSNKNINAKTITSGNNITNSTNSASSNKIIAVSDSMFSRPELAQQSIRNSTEKMTKPININTEVNMRRVHNRNIVLDENSITATKKREIESIQPTVNVSGNLMENKLEESSVHNQLIAKRRNFSGNKLLMIRNQNNIETPLNRKRSGIRNQRSNSQKQFDRSITSNDITSSNPEIIQNKEINIKDNSLEDHTIEPIDSRCSIIKSNNEDINDKVSVTESNLEVRKLQHISVNVNNQEIDTIGGIDTLVSNIVNDNHKNNPDQSNSINNEDQSPIKQILYTNLTTPTKRQRNFVSRTLGYNKNITIDRQKKILAETILKSPFIEQTQTPTETIDVSSHDSFSNVKATHIGQLPVVTSDAEIASQVDIQSPTTDLGLINTNPSIVKTVADDNNISQTTDMQKQIIKDSFIEVNHPRSSIMKRLPNRRLPSRQTQPEELSKVNLLTKNINIPVLSNTLPKFKNINTKNSQIRRDVNILGSKQVSNEHLVTENVSAEHLTGENITEEHTTKENKGEEHPVVENTTEENIALRSDPPQADLNVREQGDICGHMSTDIPIVPDRPVTSGQLAEEHQVVENTVETNKAEVLPVEEHTTQENKFETHTAEEQPAEVQPAEVQPAEVQPAEVQVAEVQPAEVQPAEVQPAEVQVAEVQVAEENKGEVPQVEENKEEVHPIEENKDEVHPVEENKAEAFQVEENKAEVLQVEENKAEVHPVEENKAEVHPVEENNTEVHPVEENNAEVHPVEENNAEVPQVEENKGEVHPVEENKAEVQSAS